MNPAPAAVEKAKTAGLESLTDSDEVKSMSDAISASLASARATQETPHSGKMAAITAPASTVAAGGGPAAPNGKHANVPVAPGAPGYRAKADAPQAEKRGRKGRRQKADGSADDERKSSKGWYVVTTLVLLVASLGVRFAMSQGLPAALGDEPLSVGDCVLGSDGNAIGAVGTGDTITVEKVDCTTASAQQVVAEVDSATQCPIGAEGIVEHGDSVFCVGPPVTDLAFDPGDG